MEGYRGESTYHVTQPYQSHVLGDLKAVGLTRTFISLKAQPGAGATLRCVVTLTVVCSLYCTLTFTGSPSVQSGLSRGSGDHTPSHSQPPRTPGELPALPTASCSRRRPRFSYFTVWLSHRPESCVKIRINSNHQASLRTLHLTAGNDCKLQCGGTPEFPVTVEVITPLVHSICCQEFPVAMFYKEDSRSETKHAERPRHFNINLIKEPQSVVLQSIKNDSKTLSLKGGLNLIFV